MTNPTDKTETPIIDALLAADNFSPPDIWADGPLCEAVPIGFVKAVKELELKLADCKQRLNEEQNAHADLQYHCDVGPIERELNAVKAILGHCRIVHEEAEKELAETKAELERLRGILRTDNKQLQIKMSWGDLHYLQVIPEIQILQARSIGLVLEHVIGRTAQNMFLALHVERNK